MKKIYASFIAFSLLFVGYLIFFAGVSFVHHWYYQMGFNLLLSLFWLPTLAIFINVYAREKGREMADEAVNDHAQELGQQAEQVLNHMLQQFEVPAHAHIETKPRKKK